MRSEAEVQLCKEWLQHEYDLPYEGALLLKERSYLCPDHCPQHVGEAAVLGKPVAQLVGGAIVYGAVVGFDVRSGLRGNQMASAKRMQGCRLRVGWRPKAGGAEEVALSRNEVEAAMNLHTAVAAETAHAAKAH